MISTYCTLVKKFERGRLFRCHCVGCVHNTAHLDDEVLYCRYLEYRITYPSNRKGETIPDRKPTVRIPPDMRG